MISPTWWKTAFDEKYIKTYVDVATTEATKHEIDFLLRHLSLTKKTQILDLACGVGRHALTLAQKGYPVTAFDYSSTLLKELAKNALSKKIELQAVHGDMRQLPFSKKFDVVINMFTAFGYFSDADNERVIKNISKSLKKGGQFVLDYANPYRTTAFILRHEPAIITHTLSNGIEITTEHVLDPLTARWFMHRTWQENGKKRSYKTAVRLYTMPELLSLFAKYHLKKVSLFGDYDDSPFTPQSQRLILLAKRI